MKRVFADSYYFFALLNENERHHRQARAFVDTFRGALITTAFVLIEVGDGMAHPRWRGAYLGLYDELLRSPSVHLLECSDELVRAGMGLYRARQDKHWSVTDCISFVVMQQQGIVEALTAD